MGIARLFAASCVAALLLAGGQARAEPHADCGPDCLKGFVDQYFAALSAHDPSHLPVARNVRFTENGVQIPLGEALWVTFKELGPYRHDITEPATGGIATFVTLKENNFWDFLMLRLKVAHKKITEIETVVVRNSRSAETMPAAEAMWDEIEPPATRLTREQLAQGAIDYMRAIALLDGKLAPFAESCIRLENGNVMSLGPNDTPPVPMPPLAPEIANSNQWQAGVRSTMGMGCAKQIDTKIYAFINSYDNARFPIIDVERQIVFGVFDFRRRGTVHQVLMPDGKTYEIMPSAQWPNEVLNTEAWKFRNGKITRIEAVFKADQDYKTGTGWPGGMKGESRPSDPTQ